MNICNKASHWWCNSSFN